MIKVDIVATVFVLIIILNELIDQVSELLWSKCSEIFKEPDLIHYSQVLANSTTVDTTSEIKISVIIDEAQIDEGANIVHTGFGLGSLE